MLDVADELKIPAYIYFTSTAALLCLCLRLPTLDDEITVDFEEFQGNVEVEGISPIPPLCMPTLLLKRKNPGYPWIVYHGRRFREAKGIIINTFGELEPKPLAALAEGRLLPDHPTTTIYPVGPPA